MRPPGPSPPLVDMYHILAVAAGLYAALLFGDAATARAWVARTLDRAAAHAEPARAR